MKRKKPAPFSPAALRFLAASLDFVIEVDTPMPDLRLRAMQRERWIGRYREMSPDDLHRIIRLADELDSGVVSQ